MSLTNNYINWLKENIIEETLDNNIVELTMPFLDRHNDHLQIYVIPIEGSSEYIISDLGYTITDLKLSGINFDTAKRKELLDFNIAKNGIKYSHDNDHLYIRSKKEDLPKAQHRLMQAVLDIDDMFYLSTSNVKSIFLEEVEMFFEKNDIYYSKNIQMLGKSGFTYNYDFMLQRNKSNNERLIKVMNTPSKTNVERYIFLWQDTAEERNKESSNTKKTEFLVFVNDENNSVNSKLTAAFDKYEITPIFWSERKKYLEKLA